MTDTFFIPIRLLLEMTQADAMQRVQYLMSRLDEQGQLRYAHPTIAFPDGAPVFALHQDRADNPLSRRIAVIVGDRPNMALTYAGENYEDPPVNGPWLLEFFGHPQLLEDIQDPPTPDDAAMCEGITVILPEESPQL